jgi:hypothetical protein
MIRRDTDTDAYIHTDARVSRLHACTDGRARRRRCRRGAMLVASQTPLKMLWRRQTPRIQQSRGHGATGPSWPLHTDPLLYGGVGQGLHRRGPLYCRGACSALQGCRGAAGRRRAALSCSMSSERRWTPRGPRACLAGPGESSERPMEIESVSPSASLVRGAARRDSVERGPRRGHALVLRVGTLSSSSVSARSTPWEPWVSREAARTLERE